MCVCRYKPYHSLLTAFYTVCSELLASCTLITCHACHRRRPGATLRFQGCAVAVRRAKRAAVSQSGTAMSAVLAVCAKNSVTVSKLHA